MIIILIVSSVFVQFCLAQQPPQPGQAPAPTPQIDWGFCPQLQPTEEEKVAKQIVLQNCLQSVTVQPNQTQEDYRKNVSYCALNQEHWFDSDGKYDYNRAMSEIRLKRLPIQFEQEILKYHMKCQSESEAKTNLDIVDKVTLYQTCMDYYISSICRIQIIQQ